MSEAWNLAEISYSVVQQQEYNVAVLPLGATEPHNLHLPYSTDTLEATIIGQHVCRAAHARGAQVVLLPTIPYGTETNMRGFPLAMNLNPSTVSLMLSELIESIENAGIDRIVLLNSHGGNTLKPVLRELANETDAHLFLCDWYHTIGDVYHEIFENPEDHAGEMETSFALAWFGELVQKDAAGKFLADDGAKRPFRFKGLNEGWISMSRPWDLLTTNSGAGNPHQATAEKGQRLMQVLVDRIGDFLVDLSAADVDDWFPFMSDREQ